MELPDEVQQKLAHMTGQGDQVEAGVVVMACVTATYYSELIKHGMPDELARAIVQDWHHLMVEKSSAKR